MVPGLLLSLALGAPPGPESAGPAPADAHADALARFGAAVWNLRRDRLLTAARQFEDAAKKDPDATAPLRELVHVYTLVGREPDAIRIARQILAKDPTDFEIAQTLAKLLFDAGQLNEAVAAAKSAAACPIPMNRAETAVGVYRDLATLCEKAGDHTVAEAAVHRALEVVVDRRKEAIASKAFTPREADRAAAECYEKLGRILTKLSKFDDAVAAFTSAAKLYDGPLKDTEPAAAARLDWNLSGVLQANGDAEAALGHLDRVLKLRPQSPDPYLRLGQLLRELNREVKIVPRLLEIERVDDKNPFLKTVLAVELASVNRMQSDKLFGEVMAATNDRKLMEIVIRSRLKESRAGQIVDDLDRLFTAIKDDEKEEKPQDTPEAAAAKAFAAEKVRVIADILRADPAAIEAVLQAVSDDLGVGRKRTHQIYYFLAGSAARVKKLQTTNFHLNRALRNCPPDAQGDVYLALIDVRRKLHDPAGVEAICREALENQKQTIAPFVYHYYQAQALAELGRTREAIAAIERAIQETGHNGRLNVKLNKVHVLSLLQKWDDAVAYANKLFDEYPALADRQEVRYNLAIVYSAAGKLDLAESQLRAILDVDPDHAGACNNLGYQFAEQGRDLDAAERLIRHAIEVDRYDNKKSGASELENGMYLDSLGWVLFRKGKLAEARAELERAVTLSSGYNHAVIWDHLGDVRFRLGDKVKAKSAWEEARHLYEQENIAPLHRSQDQLNEVMSKLSRVP